MLGTDYIRVFDGGLCPDALAKFPAVEPGVEVPLWPALEGNPSREELDQAFVDAIAGALSQYRIAFPEFTRHWTVGPEDDGFALVNPAHDPRLRFAASTEESLDAVATAVVFTNEGRYLEFPHQGIQIQGKPGRVIMFPPYWTHPYRLFGMGPLVTTNFIQPNESIQKD